MLGPMKATLKTKWTISRRDCLETYNSVVLEMLRSIWVKPMVTPGHQLEQLTSSVTSQLVSSDNLYSTLTSISLLQQRHSTEKSWRTWSRFFKTLLTTIKTSLTMLLRRLLCWNSKIKPGFLRLCWECWYHVIKNRIFANKLDFNSKYFYKNSCSKQGQGSKNIDGTLFYLKAH